MKFDKELYDPNIYDVFLYGSLVDVFGYGTFIGSYKDAVFYSANKVHIYCAHVSEFTMQPKQLGIDTKILVSMDGIKWQKGHFAKFLSDGTVNTWSWGTTSFTSEGSMLNWKYWKLP